MAMYNYRLNFSELNIQQLTFLIDRALRKAEDWPGLPSGQQGLGVPEVRALGGGGGGELGVGEGLVK